MNLGLINKGQWPGFSNGLGAELFPPASRREPEPGAREESPGNLGYLSAGISGQRCKPWSRVGKVPPLGGEGGEPKVVGGEGQTKIIKNQDSEVVQR